jgi:hypothetical protein
VSRVSINPDEIKNWFESQDEIDKEQAAKAVDNILNLNSKYSNLQMNMAMNLVMHSLLTNPREIYNEYHIPQRP